jgi:hypothetical protein
MCFLYVYCLIWPICSYIVLNINTHTRTHTHTHPFGFNIHFGDTNVFPFMKLLTLQIPHCKPLIFLLFNLIYTIMLLENKCEQRYNRCSTFTNFAGRVHLQKGQFLNSCKIVFLLK